jgi:hypothetical protein
VTPELATSSLGLPFPAGPFVSIRRVVEVGLDRRGERPSRSAICAIDRPSASRKCRASATAPRRSSTRSYAGEGRSEAMPPGIANVDVVPATDVAGFGTYRGPGCREPRASGRAQRRSRTARLPHPRGRSAAGLEAWVAVRLAGGAGAARPSRLAWFPPADPTATPALASSALSLLDRNGRVPLVRLARGAACSFQRSLDVAHRTSMRVASAQVQRLGGGTSMAPCSIALRAIASGPDAKATRGIDETATDG